MGLGNIAQRKVTMLDNPLTNCNTALGVVIIKIGTEYSTELGA